MHCDTYFYHSSKEYLNSISPSLYQEILDLVSQLPKRKTQREINSDFFWILTSKGWSYDTVPAGMDESPPDDLDVLNSWLDDIRRRNNRGLCVTSTTLGAGWHADFAKSYDGNLVQIEAQFGKVESMFKDFCGFTIARYERRLSLGIEIVMSEPSKYFSHRKAATSGMAYFEIAEKTLPAIGLDCPIWLLGIRE
jgi:hypothetical protein